MTEFPTDWHRQAYIDALEREIAGARNKRATAEEMLARADEEEANAARELARARKTERRPAAPNKETR